jgi:hypothetical protein
VSVLLEVEAVGKRYPKVARRATGCVRSGACCSGARIATP